MIKWGCKDCRKRFIGCHSTCESYKKQKEMHDKMLKEDKNKRVRQLYNSDFEMLACMHKARKYQLVQ